MECKCLPSGYGAGAGLMMALDPENCSWTQESLESKDHHLENDRIRHGISRSLESSDFREQRLENDRHHHQNQRELESRGTA
ncbi:hypothetical protein EVAR_37575_1 [Eumeta japonica]|uniref:Uncharacterized protein n=1 Tax=Eumeta variegata TaxID=151549 RepID=A0A4C1XST9_EUMVA|nr:hypothetical protein EVAR_37575_1 [Eumeta japonica]